MSLDGSKFWESLAEAAQELGGIAKESIQTGDGRKRWPGTIRTAKVTMPNGVVKLHHVDCYGWTRVID